MKKLNITQIVRLTRSIRAKRFELSKIYNSLEIVAKDLEDPQILNSFYQIKLAISALETYEENSLSVKSLLVRKSTSKNLIK